MSNTIENKKVGDHDNTQCKYSDLKCIIWLHKGEFTPVRWISTFHIVNIIKHLRVSKEKTFSGYSREEWIEAFQDELDRRDLMCLKVFSIFPVLRKMLR